MGKISAKNKIVIILAVWLVVSLTMFLYFFKILDSDNAKTLESLDLQNKELAILTAERESYIQAKTDLAQLAKEEMQPDTFFSKDITLVNEIRTLEGWADRLNVKMQLSGVSGTVNNLPKAKTATAIGTVPYTINLVGDFTQVINYIEVLENLNFITNINSISINVADAGQVSLTLTAGFYLKK